MIIGQMHFREMWNADVLYHNRKGWFSIMLDYDYKKEYSLPIEAALRPLRLKMSPPVQLENENMFIMDELESGFIKIMEHIDGTLCIPIEADKVDGNTNVVTLAEIKVSVNPETKKVQVGRISFEYGFDDLIHVLMQRISYFAKFYDCQVSVLNLKKQHGAYSKKTSVAVCTNKGC